MSLVISTVDYGTHVRYTSMLMLLQRMNDPIGLDDHAFFWNIYALRLQ